ncbi:unnamed protein product [Sphenostylis stenocarpa]|uniref:Zinc finger PHD-type domain-containing protein n=1 Tax=Sphenostylis stenocarpa TaxID=92480 RepID=A0AA86RR08_9FABA|nr:unnamed protein product [Sphenostylis stenocarpa]
MEEYCVRAVFVMDAGVGPICRPCVESRKSEENSNIVVGKRVRSPRPVLLSNPLSTSDLDQRLHKLVFEENGLPDGTEVAYYTRGQVSKWALELFVGAATQRSAPHSLRSMQDGLLARNRESKLPIRRECAALSSIPSGDWYCQFCQNMFQREKFVAHNANAVAAGRVEGVDPIKQITNRCIRIVKDIETELSGCALCRAVDFSRSGFGPRTIILCDQCEKEYHVGCLRDHKMAYLKELPEGNWLCCNGCTKIHYTLDNLLVRGAERLPESILGVIKKKQGEKGLQPINDIDVRWRLLNGKIASPETRPLLLEAVSIFHLTSPYTVICYARSCLDKVGFIMATAVKIAIFLSKKLVLECDYWGCTILDVVVSSDDPPHYATQEAISGSWGGLGGLVGVTLFQPWFMVKVSSTYRRNVRGQEFGEMYCALLIVNSTVVSAGMLRIFGTDIAELPLVATSNGKHGKGYFQTLFSCIERLLAFLNVKNLVLPAAEEAESIWTDKFGFSKMKPDQLTYYRKNCNQIVSFKGTSMLHKMVPPCRIINNQS